MITVIYRQQNNRNELVVGSPHDLFPIIYILETSASVDQYKVMESDVGIIRDFHQSYGWCNVTLTKNAPDGFNWSN